MGTLIPYASLCPILTCKRLVIGQSLELVALQHLCCGAVKPQNTRMSSAFILRAFGFLPRETYTFK